MDTYQTALALFHTKFGFNVEPMTLDKLRFRYDLINEEVGEFKEAIEGRDAEEIVDALGDILYLVMGTADLLDIDLREAFLHIQMANMRKIRGIKKGREQSGGFDVIKPDGWTPPIHTDNFGILKEIFDGEPTEENGC